MHSRDGLIANTDQNESAITKKTIPCFIVTLKKCIKVRKSCLGPAKRKGNVDATTTEKRHLSYQHNHVHETDIPQKDTAENKKNMNWKLS